MDQLTNQEVEALISVAKSAQLWGANLFINGEPMGEVEDSSAVVQMLKASNLPRCDRPKVKK